MSTQRRRDYFSRTRAEDTIELPNGTRFGTFITTHGERTIWLVVPGVPGGRVDGTPPTHERLGPLPPEWADRVRLTPGQCQAIAASTGRRCRNRTHGSAIACAIHKRRGAR